jgi:hypothetical protein
MLVLINLLVLALAFGLGAKRAMEQSRGGWQNRVLTTAEYEVVEKIMSERKDSTFNENGGGRKFSVEPQYGSDGVSELMSGDSNQQQQQQSKSKLDGLSNSSSGKLENQRKSQKEAAPKLEQYLLAANSVETIKKIGAGAFGEVFKGRLVGERETVQLKIIHINSTSAHMIKNISIQFVFCFVSFHQKV